MSAFLWIVAMFAHSRTYTHTQLRTNHGFIWFLANFAKINRYFCAIGCCDVDNFFSFFIIFFLFFVLWTVLGRCIHFSIELHNIKTRFSLSSLMFYLHLFQTIERWECDSEFNCMWNWMNWTNVCYEFN